MFQVKTGCELKLAADGDNAHLILIWSHHHFQQKNVKVLFCQKYRRRSQKCVTGILSSNLFVLQVAVLEALKNVCYRYTVIEFVCSLSTVSNTGTSRPKIVSPVYGHIICLQMQYR